MTTPAAAPANGKTGNKFTAPLDASQFEMGVTLGTGSFGRVRFSTHKVRRQRSSDDSNAGSS